MGAFKKTAGLLPLTPTQRWASAGLVTLAVAGLLLSASAYTAQPGFCANCHSMQAAYADWSRSAHQGVACNACHARPGPTGYLGRQLAFAGETFSQALGRVPERIDGTAPNSGCLRCHGAVLKGTMRTETLIVRHRDFLQSGAKCADCHLAHKDKGRKVASMPQCVICHNGTDAPAACSTCHRRDVGAGGKRDVVKINIAPMRGCDGCHSVERCSAHHGTVMPHEQNWFKEHGKIASGADEPICWRCHERRDYASCRRCHTAIPPHDMRGRPGWVSTHQAVVRDKQPYALRNCKVCHEVSFCGGCHGDAAERVYSLVAGD